MFLVSHQLVIIGYLDFLQVITEFEFEFNQKFLLNFQVVITFSNPALFSGDFSCKIGKTEVTIWILVYIFAAEIKVR
jgi:hypothetical protein